ncbi:MAG: hypothetical protein K0Q83_1172 [Deltaproteobacteria bacterium]|jgi:hypothetical protein|nr:hypothetical protein [Deltaproteobacteria bacterium]
MIRFKKHRLSELPLCNSSESTKLAAFDAAAFLLCRIRGVSHLRYCPELKPLSSIHRITITRAATV